MNNPRLELGDFRLQVNDLYASVRSRWDNPQAAWMLWQAGRDDLFGNHPQSGLKPEDRAAFSGLSYFPYDPNFRCVADVDTDVPGDVIEVILEDDGLMRLKPIGRVWLPFAGDESLSLYWILGYGGGIFLPFRDATNGGETFGGGRYLLDSIKGADLGRQSGRLVLDFNFSYNPSCAYSPQWHCPLPPPENWLSCPIRAGEKAFSSLAKPSPPNL
jgi:uncharacterized protein (DUF1684 family)